MNVLGHVPMNVLGHVPMNVLGTQQCTTQVYEFVIHPNSLHEILVPDMTYPIPQTLRHYSSLT